MGESKRARVRENEREYLCMCKFLYVLLYIDSTNIDSDSARS